MPVYRFYPLPHDEAVRPVEKTLYNDDVAMKSAFKAAAEVAGVEVWQGERFVGVVHTGAATPPAG
jgi:hypothetical protein